MYIQSYFDILVKIRLNLKKEELYFNRIDGRSFESQVFLSKISFF